MKRRHKVDNHAGLSVLTYDGAVIVTLWLKGRNVGADPFSVELTPGQCLTLIAGLAIHSRACLTRALA